MSFHGRLCDEAALGETIWRNEYVCPNCDEHWHDDWSAQCDDECPACGTQNISPDDSKDVTAEYLVAEEEGEGA